MIKRRECRIVKIGNKQIGGNSPILVQSMLNKEAHDISANIEQAKSLEKIGCDIIRLSVPDKEAVKTIYELKKNITIPLVADIHFDYNLALLSADAGADKIRINPGNIGSDDKVKMVVDRCKKSDIPIRIGVNGGSLEKDILAKYSYATPEALCESAMYHIALLEKFEYDNIVVSIKSSNVQTMINSYRLLATKCKYPLHLGVTETGTKRMGTIKSAIGIGSLLCDGIGDTIRVSLTSDPSEEIYAGYDILKCSGIDTSSPYLISCPTCGRTSINLIKIAGEVEERLKNIRKPIKVAVMGCVVNGPGESREADIAICGGKGYGLIIKKGEILRKVPENELINELMKEIEKM